MALHDIGGGGRDWRSLLVPSRCSAIIAVKGAVGGIGVDFEPGLSGCLVALLSIRSCNCRFFGRLVVSVCSCAAVGVGVNRRRRDCGGGRVDTFAAGVRLAEVGEEEQWVVVRFSVVVMRGQFCPRYPSHQLS